MKNLSDQTVKEEIVDYTTGLTELLQVRPVSFKYKKDFDNTDRDTHVGVIAQEVESILPFSVTDVNYGGQQLKMYSHNPVIYTLVNAVKELHARLAVLEGQ